MIPPFVLHRPSTLEAAVALLVDLGEDARVLAGGTELLLVLREHLLDADHVVDIKRIPGLAGVRTDAASGRLRIGAATVHTDLAASPDVAAAIPVLADLARGIANVRVRNQGTIGGNLVFAEPHADPPALLAAADAVVHVTGRDGLREVAAGDWVVGAFESAIRPGEILTEISIPIPGPATAFGYQRLRALERPSVSVAVRLDTGPDHRIAGAAVLVACAADRPQRIVEAGEALVGLPPDAPADAPAMRRMADAVESLADASGDAYGPADWKRAVAATLARRAAGQAMGA